MSYRSLPDLFAEVRSLFAALERKIAPDHFDPALSKQADICVALLGAEGTS